MSYYLTKSNPNVYKLRDALTFYRGMSDVSWTTCKPAKPGDILFIGQSGEEAGIYAREIVASTTTFEAPLEEPDHLPFFVNPEDARKLAWMALLEPFENLKHPILEHNLKAILILERVAKLLHIQGAAYHLTEEGGEAIDRLIEASEAA